MTPEAGDAADDTDDPAEASSADGTTPGGADEPMQSGTGESSQRGAAESETSDAEEPDVAGFDLSCTDCSFETTVEGSVTDAFDAADAHQEEHGETPTGHFVNFERRGGE